jgi:hypothetical protein
MHQVPYMFRHMSHHLQGELMYSLLKTTCLYTAISYGIAAASQNIKDKTLFNLQKFYNFCNRMCYITMIYVTKLKKSTIEIFYLLCVGTCLALIGCRKCEEWNN